MVSRGILTLSLVLAVIGCAGPREKTVPIGGEGIHIKKIAIMPFQSDVGLDRYQESIQCPLCGTVFRKGRIERNAEERLTTLVFDYLQVDTQYELIPPPEVRGAMSQVFSRRFDSNTIPFIVDIGRAVGADAVLVSYVYRYKERVGTSYSVKNPASVAFDLHLVSVKRGAILWKGGFDKTQRSLSENIFQIRGFIKGGAKWLTVDEWTSQGLEQTMKTFPKYY